MDRSAEKFRITKGQGEYGLKQKKRYVRLEPIRNIQGDRKQPILGAQVRNYLCQTVPLGYEYLYFM
jgi:hypothetical protein